MEHVVAIHGSNGFARDWPECAARLGVQVRHVDAYGRSLWSDLEGCSALLWSVDHDKPHDLMFARSILRSVEQRGLRVFPDHPTVWHFDDKVAQKYLLEAIGAPLADTYVFFERGEANAFLDTASYPLVFKLRGGAGSLNVRLVRGPREGKMLVTRMFGAGLRAYPPGAGIQRAAQRMRQSRPGAGSLLERGGRAAGKLFGKIFHPQRERGYVLFQRFVEGNKNDTRVTVLGDRAFAFTRQVRPHDFRASGSGLIGFPEGDQVPFDMIEAAFGVARELGTQSLALDFVRDPSDQRPVLLEISFAFVATFVEACPGYTTPGGAWRAGHFKPAELILRDLLDLDADARPEGR